VKLTELFPAEHSGEPVIPLIEALHCGVERTVIVNVLNDGEYIEGIPRDFQVEIPALCSRKGIQGVKCNPLPKHILSFIYREKIAPCEMELAAYERGSYDLLLAMVLMDPYSKSEAQARGFLDEILAMPQHGVMRGHYKR
jgi:alpha-galactosidase